MKCPNCNHEWQSELETNEFVVSAFIVMKDFERALEHIKNLEEKNKQLIELADQYDGKMDKMFGELGKVIPLIIAEYENPAHGVVSAQMKELMKEFIEISKRKGIGSQFNESDEKGDNHV